VISDQFLRWYLPMYAAVYLGWIVWRSRFISRQIGKSPRVFGRSDSVYDYVGRWFTLIRVLVIVLIMIFVVSEDVYQRLVPIPYLEVNILRVIGLGLASIALVWIVLAQTQMGGSWRMGIDRNTTTALVAHGLFSRSRNPIYLGMMLMLFGLFLGIPNAVSLLMFVLSYVLMQIQVRLEEDFMTQTHGEEYRSYCQRVRRWL
jgi:protein-S-isoprenylcysteine O-methyltransferase Ste14